MNEWKCIEDYSFTIYPENMTAILEVNLYELDEFKLTTSNGSEISMSNITLAKGLSSKDDRVIVSQSGVYKLTISNLNIDNLTCKISLIKELEEVVEPTIDVPTEETVEPTIPVDPSECQHIPFNINYNWNNDYTKCTATGSCYICKEKYINEEGYIIVSDNSSCTHEGEKTITAMFFEEGLSNQVKIITTPKLSHTYSELYTQLPVECGEYGLKSYYRCNKCLAYFDENKMECELDDLYYYQSHDYVDGECLNCGDTYIDYYVQDLYIRGTMNSWGVDEKYKLDFDSKTATSSIRVSLIEGEAFKIADKYWNFVFGYSDVLLDETYFSYNSEDIMVLVSGDYVVTVTGFDSYYFTVEVKAYCIHKYSSVLAPGETCKFIKTCAYCNKVEEYIEHDYRNSVICYKCGYEDIEEYYVKGSFNNYITNKDFALILDKNTWTATVDVWLKVGHSFKVGTAEGWEFSYDENSLSPTAKDAFIMDENMEYLCVANSSNALGVKFTITIFGMDTLEPRIYIDTLESYTVDSETSKIDSKYFVMGSMNNFVANEEYRLLVEDGIDKTIIDLREGDIFIISTNDYSEVYNYNNSNFDSGLFAFVDYGTFSVLTPGTYEIIVSSSNCFITLVSKDEPNDDLTEENGKVTIYFYTSVWDVDSPVIWVHAWNANGSVDKVMTRTANGQFVVQLDEGYTNIIFVRGETGSLAGDWDKKWNQTGDLIINGNIFTLNSWDYEGFWSTTN